MALSFTGTISLAVGGAAISICLLLPPSMPFLFIDDLPAAMRVSSAVAVVKSFSIGARLGKYMGRSPGAWLWLSQ